MSRHRLKSADRFALPGVRVLPPPAAPPPAWNLNLAASHESPKAIPAEFEMRDTSGKVSPSGFSGSASEHEQAAFP